MFQTSKLFFLLVGCIMPIFIGSLHTYVHFKDLLNSEIEEYLQKQFMIAGQEQALWDTLGIVSFMMGMSFIVIGLLNLYIFKSIPKSKPLPLMPILVMGAYQLGVIYVGHEYNQAFQFYGGIFGLVVTVLCVAMTIQLKSNK